MVRVVRQGQEDLLPRQPRQRAAPPSSPLPMPTPTPPPPLIANAFADAFPAFSFLACTRLRSSALDCEMLCASVRRKRGPPVVRVGLEVGQEASGRIGEGRGGGEEGRGDGGAAGRGFWEGDLGERGGGPGVGGDVCRHGAAGRERERERAREKERARETKSSLPLSSETKKNEKRNLFFFILSSRHATPNAHKRATKTVSLARFAS